MDAVTHGVEHAADLAIAAFVQRHFDRRVFHELRSRGQDPYLRGRRAAAIVEDDATYELFAPYELVWAGGVAGRTALQSAYWAARITETAQGYRSRTREAKRKRAAEAIVAQITEDVQRANDEAIDATAEQAAMEAEQAMEAVEAEEAGRRPA